MEERLFRLITLDLRRLGYQLAVRNNKKHNFNNEKETAGVDWLNGFLKRQPELSIRKPEATSAARAMAFNRVSVGNFYQLLRSPIQAVCRDLTSSFKNASPKDILPIPAVQINEKRKNCRRGKTAIITSSPYKTELEALKFSKNVPVKRSKSS